MSNILYAWEFGSAYGHIGAFLPLAKALREGGHAVHWAVAQTASAARLLAPEGFAWLQAPAAVEAKRDYPPLSYADILLRFGYGAERDLRGLVVAWRELMRLSGAKLVLADHAPTAILAARSLGLPVMLYSYGFCVPPPVSPLPGLRPWQPTEPALLAHLEQEALASVNAVLAGFAQAPLQTLAELFRVAEDSVLTYPELDHFGPARGPARYWGSPLASVSGEAPPWPAGDGPRVFAYLRHEVGHAEAVLAALRGLGYPTVAVFPDAPAELVARQASPSLVIRREPVDTGAALREARLGVTYAGHGLTAAFLMAGKPLLLAPSQLEQFLLAQRVEQLGAGLLVNPEQLAGDLMFKLQRLVLDPRFAEAAGGFAARYRDFSQQRIIDNLVKRVDALCGAGEGARP